MPNCIRPSDGGGGANLISVPAAADCLEITALGLACGITEQCSDTVPANAIISQNPAAGAMVAPGSSVDLIRSLGPCVPIAVPNATSCADIEALGLVCQLIESCDGAVVAGDKISQFPPAGFELNAGETVTLTISTGPCPLEGLVGEYTDCNGPAEDGFACIEAFGCSDTVPEGEVIGQSPIPGDTFTIGSSVTLTISNGPCPVLLPTFANCAEVEALGLVCTELIECGDAVPAGEIISQDPVPGQMAFIGSEVTIVRSNGPCLAFSTAFNTCADVLAAGYVCLEQYACSNTISQGGVIDQYPASGIGLAPGSTIRLTISTGNCTIAMPDLTNSNCKTMILLAGFPCEELLECSPVPPSTSLNPPNGEVLSQWPPAGTVISVDPPQHMTITRSSGPCPVGDLVMPCIVTTGPNAMPPDTIPFINAAVNKWNTVLGGDLSPVLVNGVAITGVEICFECAFNLAPNELAVAGPVSFRGDGFPATGQVRLNCNRLNEFRANGRLNTIFTHEIAHALGMGLSNLWNQFVINDNTSAAGFCGPLALAEYNAIHPNGPVNCIPTDNVAGHWSEITSEGMRNELLSPIWTGNNAFSRITIMSFADMGYQVNPQACPDYQWNQP